MVSSFKESYLPRIIIIIISSSSSSNSSSSSSSKLCFIERLSDF